VNQENDVMDRRLLLMGGAAVVAVGGFAAYQRFSGPSHTPGTAQANRTGRESFDPDALLEAGPLPDMKKGRDDAPVKLIEYASMTCPHCASFHTERLPALTTEYVDTGRAQVIFREYPIGGNAILAAMIARCAGDQGFFPMIDVMFKTQGTWARQQDPRDALFQIARQAGFTQDSFNACLNNQSILDGINWIKDRAAVEFEVDSTPTFFVNGKLIRGNATVDRFREEIEAAMVA
jgi:protein-disulfide isomerase